MTTVAAFANKCAGVARKIESDTPNLLAEVGKTAKESTLALAAPPTGGDLIFSGTAKAGKGKPIDVVVSKQGTEAIKVKAIGPMHWLESGVKRHSIVPGNSRRGPAAGLLGRNLTGGALGPVIQGSSLFSKGNYAASKKGAGVVLKFRDGTYSRYADNAGGFKARGTWTKGLAATEALVPGITGKRVLGNMAEFFGR